jgi:hypothetical protein
VLCFLGLPSSWRQAQGTPPVELQIETPWSFDSVTGEKDGTWQGRLLLNTDQPVVALALAMEWSEPENLGLIHWTAVEQASSTALADAPILNFSFTGTVLENADYLIAQAIYPTCFDLDPNSPCNQDFLGTRMELVAVLDLSPPFASIPPGIQPLVEFDFLYSGATTDPTYGSNPLAGLNETVLLQLQLVSDPLWSVLTYPDASEQLLQTAAPLPIPIGVTASFLRGDADQSGAQDLADAVLMLQALFINPPLACPLAGDANADDQFDLSDPVLLLEVLFGALTEGPAPWNTCGSIPTPSPLPCPSPHTACP